MNKLIATLAAVLTCFLPSLALAADGAAGSEHNYAYAVAMALGIGLAALGGGMGQGRAAAAALEGICRNPNASDKVFVPMILALSFIESLVIFALVISFLIFGKFGG